MNLQSIVIVGLVVLSASGTSGKPEFKKSVPIIIYRRESQECTDCEIKGGLIAVVTALGSTGDALFEILQALGSPGQQDPKLALDATIAKVPDIMDKAKDKFKLITPCSQLDEFISSLVKNTDGYLLQILKDLPELVSALHDEKLPEQVGKTLQAMRPIVTILFGDGVTNLLGIMGLCSSLNTIKPLVPPFVNAFLGLMGTLISALVAGTLSKTFAAIVPVGPGGIVEMLLKALPSLQTGGLLDGLTKQLSGGLPAVVAELVQAILNILIAVIKGCLVKNPLLADAGELLKGLGGLAQGGGGGLAQGGGGGLVQVVVGLVAGVVRLLTGI